MSQPSNVIQYDRIVNLPTTATRYCICTLCEQNRSVLFMTSPCLDVNSDVCLRCLITGYIVYIVFCNMYYRELFKADSEFAYSVKITGKFVLAMDNCNKLL